MDRTNGHRKYVELTSEQLQILKDKEQIHTKLQAPSPEEALQDFYRVLTCELSLHFWIDGIKINRNVRVPPNGPLVKIGIVHEGDSIYYHPQDNIHFFARDCLQPSWSY